jgi:hypothetical protein
MDTWKLIIMFAVDEVLQERCFMLLVSLVASCQLRYPIKLVLLRARAHLCYQSEVITFVCFISSSGDPLELRVFLYNTHDKFNSCKNVLISDTSFLIRLFQTRQKCTNT